MPVSRDSFPATFTLHQAPKWSCRYCGHTVGLVKDGIAERETGKSQRYHDHPDWEPDWIEGHFTAKYACGNCGDPATVLGTYELHEEPWQPHASRAEYYSSYTIRAIEPAPALIRVSERVPDAVRTELDRSYRLFWIDSAACANSIRGVVEVFLNEMRVNKTSGTRRSGDRLTLHRRIQLFAKKDAHLADALMATKWIGNVGSHAAPVSREALFNGFDLLEHVLEEAFDPPRKRVARMAKNINRRKGKTPRRRGSV